MFRLFILLTITCFISSCKNNGQPPSLSKNQHTHATFRILTFGLPFSARVRAENIVAKKYGIEYYPVAGCVISAELVDSIRKENRKVYEKLSALYGTNWTATFAKEVSVMTRQQQEAEKIVRKEPYIKRLETILQKDSSYPGYFIAPTEQENVFLVRVYGWETSHDHSIPITYFEVTVDLTKKEVIKVSDNRKTV